MKLVEIDGLEGILSTLETDRSHEDSCQASLMYVPKFPTATIALEEWHRFRHGKKHCNAIKKGRLLCNKRGCMNYIVDVDFAIEISYSSLRWKLTLQAQYCRNTENKGGILNVIKIIITIIKLSQVSFLDFSKNISINI